MIRVTIPRERLLTMMGKDGSRRSSLERDLSVKLSVEENTVTIEGDPLSEVRAMDFVKAVGRGFPPDRAMLLMDDDYLFQLIDISDYVKRRSLRRMRGRVIGAEGRARRDIENLTRTSIEIYGHTIGLIGKEPDVEIAREGVIMLLTGAKHSTVYSFIERRMKEAIE
jgi:ribosomal RNA assembly protein